MDTNLTQEQISILAQSIIIELSERSKNIESLINIISTRKLLVSQASNDVADLFEGLNGVQFLEGLKYLVMRGALFLERDFLKYCTDFNGDWTAHDYKRLHAAYYHLYAQSESRIREITGDQDQQWRVE